MALQVYNVRTRQKEPFTPLDPDGRVGMYVCGLTVYDHVHLGHARTYASFEIIRSWLEISHAVRFVQNVTDVEDKIIARAVELGVSPREHSAAWDAKAAESLARLGVRPPDEAPHATTSMDGIIRFIERILGKGFAYATDVGNVYFDVPAYDAYARQTFPEAGYGSLSRRDYREMAAGTRKHVESDKQHPADFALWKTARAEDPEDARWDGPWGPGRPGWHIECSHMSTAALGGDRIDIHGGGQDLIFPHHENEIAQTQAASGEAPFANVWIHTGFLNVDGQKMSKSLGNFLILDDVLQELESAASDGADPAETLRFYFAQNHYRSKIDFSHAGLQEARTAVARLQRTRRRLAQVAGGQALGCADVDPPLEEAADALTSKITAAMDDDFHTPAAVAALFDFQRLANSALDGPEESPLGSQAAGTALAAFEAAGQALTLFRTRVHGGKGPPAEVLTLHQARQVARAAKDWAEADALRDQIAGLGWKVQDRPDGSSLEPL